MNKFVKFLEGEFWSAADSKDDYLVRDLKDPKIRMVVWFFNPIFHPGKSKRLVFLWASTFSGCFRKKLEVDWAYLMTNLVKHLVRTTRNVKSKSGTPL